jgi:ArsR family transcriptional regulator
MAKVIYIDDGQYVSMKRLDLFRALGDETRLKIVEFLMDGEKCVCEIFPHVKRTQSTVSIQLGKMEDCGILSSRREGKKIYYRISDEKVRKIMNI